jgi:deoxyribodipyrimidine photo-lyase
MRTLVWFRGKDLRVSDHAPLLDAVQKADRWKPDEVIPLFVVDPYFFAPSRAAELPHRMQFPVESLLELATGVPQRAPLARARLPLRA